MHSPSLRYIHKFTREEYFPDKTFPFFVQRYIHDWSSVPILPMHSHEFIEMVFVVKGSVTHYFESEQHGELKYKIYPGDIFIINPGERHTYEIGREEKVELVNLLFLPQLLNWNALCAEEHADLMSLFYVQPFGGHEVRFQSLLKLDEEARARIHHLIGQLEEEFERRPPGYQSLVGLKLMELIIYLSRQLSRNAPSVAVPKSCKGQGGGGLKNVIAYIERNYTNEIAIKELTDIAMCSPRHLSRMFKQEMGASIIQYLHKLRVEQAKKYLLSTSGKVVSIGQEVGFPDATFFNKVFKKYEGCTPTEYKQRYSRHSEAEGETR